MIRPTPLRASSPRLERAAPVPQLLTCSRWPEAKYFLAAPSRPVEGAPVLVSVHGISRNAREHVQIFASSCSRLGWFVVAPRFSRKAFPKYQQLGFSTGRQGPRPDLALNAILDEVGTSTGANTGQVYLFGYSGGGQFAHRYAMLHPRRVVAAAFGASGWYTFPDPRQRFPRGLGRVEAALAAEIDLPRFLRLPISVLVGREDVERDEALNASPRIDRQQGSTRRERAHRWVATLKRAAAAAGLDTPYEFVELPGCGHSFTDCVDTGRLDLQALDFFVRSQAGRRLRPASGDAPAGRPSPAAFVH